MDFWFELELDFLRVAGVEAEGVEDFFAIFDSGSEKTSFDQVCSEVQR